MSGIVLVPSLWEFDLEGKLDMETNNYFPTEWTDHSAEVQETFCWGVEWGRQEDILEWVWFKLNLKREVVYQWMDN